MYFKSSDLIFLNIYVSADSSTGCGAEAGVRHYGVPPNNQNRSGQNQTGLFREEESTELLACPTLIEVGTAR